MSIQLPSPPRQSKLYTQHTAPFLFPVLMLYSYYIPFPMCKETFNQCSLLISELSSFLDDLPKDLWASKTGMQASLVFLSTSLAASRGLTSDFSTASNLAVAHGAAPTLFVLGASMVRVDASSRDAYHECPHAIHSN